MDVFHAQEERVQELMYQAAASPRLRAHLLLHTTPKERQRMLIAMQPGTYIPPHVHYPTPTWPAVEQLTVLNGSLGLILFGAALEIQEARVLNQDDSATIPARVGHTVVSLAPDTVVYESKDGGRPDPDREWLPGFPAEGEPFMAAWLETWQLVLLGAGSELAR